MTPAQEIARLREQLDDALYQIRLLKGEPYHLPLVAHVGLSDKEARAVSMVLRRGRVTRDALYQALYGSRHPDEMPDGHAVVRLMSRARKRLRSLGVDIQNVWGVGYSITPENVARLKTAMGHNVGEMAA